MKLRILGSLSMCFLILTSALAASGQDLKVFDLELNKPFDIRECTYRSTDIEMLGTGSLLRGRKKVKMYEYTEAKPTAGRCFQRVGESYTMTPVMDSPAAKKLPAVTPIVNGHVRLVYADSLRPSIAPSEDVWLGIQDSKLTGVRFYFPNLRANEIFSVVEKKYGKPVSVENFNIQNSIGGRKDFYKATWTFQNLTVTFFSLDTRRIGYDPAPPNDMDRGYSSTIGSVTIQYGSNAQRRDNNPL